MWSLLSPHGICLAGRVLLKNPLACAEGGSIQELPRPPFQVPAVAGSSGIWPGAGHRDVAVGNGAVLHAQGVTALGWRTQTQDGSGPPNSLTPKLYSSETQDSVSSPGSKCPFMSASPIVTKSSSSSREERVPVPIAPDPSSLRRRGQHLCRGQTGRRVCSPRALGIDSIKRQPVGQLWGWEE